MCRIEVGPLAPGPEFARCIACPICYGEEFKVAIENSSLVVECANALCTGYRLQVEAPRLSVGDLPRDGLLAGGKSKLRL